MKKIIECALFFTVGFAVNNCFGCENTMKCIPNEGFWAWEEEQRVILPPGEIIQERFAQIESEFGVGSVSFKDFAEKRLSKQLGNKEILPSDIPSKIEAAIANYVYFDLSKEQNIKSKRRRDRYAGVTLGLSTRVMVKALLKEHPDIAEEVIEKNY